jgi:hypothetical protein
MRSETRPVASCVGPIRETVRLIRASRMPAMHRRRRRRVRSHSVPGPDGGWRILQRRSAGDRGGSEDCRPTGPPRWNRQRGPNGKEHCNSCQALDSAACPGREPLLGRERLRGLAGRSRDRSGSKQFTRSGLFRRGRGPGPRFITATGEQVSLDCTRGSPSFRCPREGATGTGLRSVDGPGPSA